MVAKKTAVKQSASGRSRGAAASDGDTKGDGEEQGTRATAADPSGKTPGEKGSAKNSAAKRAPVRKAAEKRAAAKKADGEKAAGKAAAVVKHTVDRSEMPEKSASRAAATKTAAEKGTAKKSTAKKAGAARAAKQTGATTVVAKKTPGTAAAAESAVPKARVATAAPGELAVRPGEDPWTPQEVEEARTELMAEAIRLRAEIEASESALAGLMRDSGDGAGDDQADTGTKNITREHELALAANAREMLEQTERALQRLDAGTYGLCENCGNAIGKARMQAFPRATLCVECKQKQERRY
ncbi:TraR/DksA family transcriptional regulator [Streptomyces sp. GbtcB6]|uniref:TraR/DksA family transcriptional regulator n=1 Tax=Streptomyces sp. GbtcB6 TaxID=2824751 RepID=UPI001C31177F|nr:TraR/DksA family transcriptional regulator [Streptomyces sp. GbtcB6]